MAEETKKSAGQDLKDTIEEIEAAMAEEQPSVDVEDSEAPVEQVEGEQEESSESEELLAMRDQVVRAQAEIQNVRRRAEQDVSKARKFALEKIVGDLLPVVDNLERAIQSIDKANPDLAPVLEGIELTYKSFLDTLTKHQVEAINPAGEPFDPQLHEAMTMVPNPDLEPNTVMDVFQQGYMLNGRLIRPARVVVSKAVE